MSFAYFSLSINILWGEVANLFIVSHCCDRLILLNNNVNHIIIIINRVCSSLSEFSISADLKFSTFTKFRSLSFLFDRCMRWCGL